VITKVFENVEQNTDYCTLRAAGGERIVDVAPGGAELEPQVKTCSWADCHVVGPCHHGMACPQVADRGTASDKEGSCE